MSERNQGLRKQLENSVHQDILRLQAAGLPPPHQVGVGIDGEKLLKYVDSLEEEVKKLKQELYTSHSIRTSFASDIETQHRLHNEEIEKLTSLVKKLQLENQSLMLQNQDYATKVLSLTKELEDLRKQQAVAKKDLADLREQQAVDKKELTSLQEQQTQDQAEIKRLGKSVQNLEEDLGKINALREFSQWVEALRTLLLDAIKAENNSFQFSGWPSFAEAEAAELWNERKWEKSKQGNAPSLPLHSALVAKYTSWGFTQDDWAKLRDFKSMRDDYFHPKDTAYDKAVKMLDDLPQSLKGYSSVLAKAMKEVNDRW